MDNNKFINSYKVEDYEVWTENGWVDIQEVHETIPFDVWRLETDNYFLECADEHIVINGRGGEVYVRDLKIGDEIITETGIEKVKSVVRLDVPPQKMYDISIDSESHTFFTNGILSHNSTLATIFALWICCFTSDQNMLIVANKEDTAISIFSRIRLAYELLPNYLKPGVKEYGKTAMVLANGSAIRVSTTTSSAARGMSINVLFIDEAAHIDSHLLEEFWKSVIPTISSGKKSKIFMVSTPNGIGNKFYEMYSGAEKGTNGWTNEKIDWWDVPGRNEKWKKDMINTLGSEESFAQEFGNVFLDSATAAVGFNVIQDFKEQKRLPIWKSEDGTYRVYENPDKNNLYVIGCDVGEGVGRASSTAHVLNVTDLTKITQAAVYGSNTIEPYHFANRLVNLCGSWGNPPLLIERNNCGAQTLDALAHNLLYEKIVSYGKVGQTGDYKSTKGMGVFSHNNIRFNAVSNLRYWINFLQVVKIYDMQTISELETFIRFPNGVYRKKGEKYYDDYVMGLVWSLFMLETDLCQQYFNIDEHDDQQKPLKISRNDYYENDSSLYSLKDLTNGNVIIPSGYDISVKKYTSLTGDLNLEDDLDIDDLIDLGYTIYRP